jgi:hypothetical protein
MFFVLRFIVRTVGYLLIVTWFMGGDPLAASFVIFFWTAPIAIVVLVFGLFEKISDKYGTYMTSLVSFVPLAIELSANGWSVMTLNIFGKSAILSIILWVSSGLLIRSQTVSISNRASL